jgi:hypothetical protein
MKLKKSLKKQSCASTVDTSLALEALMCANLQQNLASFFCGFGCSATPVGVLFAELCLGGSVHRPVLGETRWHSSWGALGKAFARVIHPGLVHLTHQLRFSMHVYSGWRHKVIIPSRPFGYDQV